MRVFVAFLLSLTLTVASSITPPRPAQTLDIYLIDVEGGSSTLIVSPSGDSILIDTGNLAAAARDAGRIMAAVKDAGLQQVDHLITTHWHLDHIGGMAELANSVPIREFIDHGANIQRNPQTDAFLQKTYPALYDKAKRRVVKPGDKIPIAGLEVRVVSSAGKTIKTSLSEAGMVNPHCSDFSQPDADMTENSQSIGSHITFGRFRALHLGDLTSDKEFELMCPNNRIGTVDLFVVSHHGQPSSNSAVLVHAIESRAAIMNNGTRKGGQPNVMKLIHSAPGLEDLWQLHFSQLSGQEYTVPGMFIANHPDEPESAIPVAPMPTPQPGEAASAPVHNGAAYWIKVSAQPDGSFTVTNGRNGFSKTYHAR